MRWFWYFATRKNDKFSLSLIFLDFTIERYIPDAELGYDVGHVLVGSWAIAPSSSLAPIVTQRTIFATYDHLADVVGGSSATANPLNEH